jgi:hypothetical protein
MVFAALAFAVNADPIGSFAKGLGPLLVMILDGKGTLLAGVA